MNVLVIGGTGFVGRETVRRLIADGHDVTVFNRGSRPTEARQLVGDRDEGDYAALATGEWDAVVDAIAYFPDRLGATMDVLGDRVGRYVLVSSHVVFDGAGPGLRAPMRDVPRALTDETYGPSKVACEQDLVARYGDRATIVRPCKVAGPGDNQRGLTYWVRRAAKGGRIALPADPEQPVQVVDVRDVAGLIVTLIGEKKGGAFTAAGPSMTFTELIARCAAVAGTEVEVVPVPTRWFPLVKRPQMWATQHRTPAGEQVVTPFETTARDTLAWDRDRGEPPLEEGFTPAEEEDEIRRASRP